jgi:hypothetical protein
MISGSCGNITLEPTNLVNVVWSELDSNGDDVLEKAELKGNVFKITSEDPIILSGLIASCFGIEDEVWIVCMKIVSVHNFTGPDEADGYSADVILLRLVE